jgi:single-stranded-DNA-specific exonuclease
VRNAGLRALLDVAGFTGNTVPTARQVAFQIAPRLNAAGRMDTAMAVIEMFLSSDPERARELARQLDERNTERRQVEDEIRDTCERQAVDESASALVYYGENWHRGVLGIVASRLVERHHRPVFVLGRNPEDGLAQGSGRSIPAFNLLEAIEAMPDLFVRFGGHRHAAGVTLEVARIDEFRQRFNTYAAACLLPEYSLDIDAVVDFGDIADSGVQEVLALAPFGHGNPTPLVAALDVEIAGQPVVMKEKHLRVPVRRNGRALALKAWNFAHRAGEMPPGARVDIAFTLEDDPYSAARGYPGWAAVLRDVRAAKDYNRTFKV